MSNTAKPFLLGVIISLWVVLNFSCAIAQEEMDEEMRESMDTLLFPEGRKLPLRDQKAKMQLVREGATERFTRIFRKRLAAIRRVRSAIDKCDRTAYERAAAAWKLDWQGKVNDWGTLLKDLKLHLVFAERWDTGAGPIYDKKRRERLTALELQRERDRVELLREEVRLAQVNLKKLRRIKNLRTFVFPKNCAPTTTKTSDIWIGKWNFRIKYAKVQFQFDLAFEVKRVEDKYIIEIESPKAVTLAKIDETILEFNFEDALNTNVKLRITSPDSFTGKLAIPNEAPTGDIVGTRRKSQ